VRTLRTVGGFVTIPVSLPTAMSAGGEYDHALQRFPAVLCVMVIWSSPLVGAVVAALAAFTPDPWASGWMRTGWAVWAVGTLGTTALFLLILLVTGGLRTLRRGSGR